MISRNKMNRRRKWGLTLILCLLFGTAFFCACKAPKEVIKGFGGNELFRIDSASCSKGEYLVYLTTTRARYEAVYGKEVWQVSMDNETMEDNVKDTVLAKIAQVKTLYLFSKSKEVVLDEQEEQQAADAAKEYYNGLNDKSSELLGLKEEDILQMFREYALAEKVYQSIIQSINPEISDDEARTITVDKILLKTYTTDGTGEKVEYSDAMKNDVFDKAAQILQRALDGEDFETLAKEYSNEEQVRFSFGKDEVDPALEKAAFCLETDEISAVIATEEGYQIIKCISTFDKEQTERSKQELLEKRRKEAFTKEYDAFTEGVSKRLNEKLFQQISVSCEEEPEVPDFFEIYSKYF